MSSEPRAEASGGVPVPAEPAPLLAFADQLLADEKGNGPGVSGEIRQYVAFGLRDQEFAIPILNCREILRVGAITRIPEAPASVRGVVNLRGRIIPVVDLRICLRLDQAAVTARTRLVIVEVAGRLFALLVDRVAGLLKLASSETGPAPNDSEIPYLTGTFQTDKKTVGILDVEQMLLASPGMRPSTDKERPNV